MKARLKSLYKKNVSNAEILEDIRRVALGRKQEYISENDYAEHGRYTVSRVRSRFSSWAKAVARASLSPRRRVKFDIDDLFYNLLVVWLKLGRRPSTSEFRRPLSKFSVHPYLERFGSWRRALAIFFDWLHWGDPPGGPRIEPPEDVAGAVYVGPDESDLTMDDLFRPRRRRKAPRAPRRKVGLRQRFRVMQRDAFRCRLCGRSPATHAGLHLEIDHVVPWSKGGETVESNLQTLCSDCNQGKSDRHEK